MRALEFFVAQVSNLLYRRLPACGLWNALARGRPRTVADWKSATQQVRKPALPGRVPGPADGRAPQTSLSGPFLQTQPGPKLAPFLAGTGNRRTDFSPACRRHARGPPMRPLAIIFALISGRESRVKNRATVSTIKTAPRDSFSILSRLQHKLLGKAVAKA